MVNSGKALIFDVRRFSTHDGPGIRTTVFFKGCPLRCLWCHNPESQSVEMETYTRTCQFDGRLFEKEESIGRWISMPELMTEIMRDQPFMEESGGGVTLSGGEPLAQAAFVAGFLKELKRNGLHTALDTSGHVPVAALQEVIPYTDLFLYDLKGMHPEKHLRHTGADNRLIIYNLQELLRQKKQVIVRYPVIPGYTDAEDDITGILSLMVESGGILDKIHLLPWHNLGQSKQARYGLKGTKAPEQSCENNTIERISRRFISAGINVKIGG
jgi:pyruvate formate lyase activating enzyme